MSGYGGNSNQGSNQFKDRKSRPLVNLEVDQDPRILIKPENDLIGVFTCIMHRNKTQIEAS